MCWCFVLSCVHTRGFSLIICRPDHNLQDIRAKIFPLKRRKVEAPEVTPTNSLPVKRKERSLSSLVVSTPKVPMQTGLTGRRTKAARKAAIRGGFAVEEHTKKEDSAEDHPVSSSSHDSQNKITRNKRQVKEDMFDPLCLCDLKFDFVSTFKLSSKAITYLYCNYSSKTLWNVAEFFSCWAF